MSTKLYVGNLPWTFNSDELLDTFKKHGNVISAKVVTDKETGKSKGFGFVEMENDSDANSATKALNGSEINGRKLVVAAAKTS
ncbi:MAG: RNA-binding protein [Ignavibacteria bacterium]|nr:RNA-binding protein [Ignavibacteria bacterium]